MLGDRSRARTLIEKAVSSGNASWRAWNALGALCDFERDWDGADAAYATADELSPNQAEVLNNHGWSLIVRGEWASAIEALERAVQLDPESSRIANNLELARASVAADLPKRRNGESDFDFAARLNDSGVAAERLGDRDRAIAAFSRALAVSGAWHSRAANNLERLQAQ
jgi:Flp pilus assembly protein TadD